MRESWQPCLHYTNVMILKVSSQAFNNRGLMIASEFAIRFLIKLYHILRTYYFAVQMSLPEHYRTQGGKHKKKRSAYSLWSKTKIPCTLN